MNKYIERKIDDTEAIITRYHTNKQTNKQADKQTKKQKNPQKQTMQQANMCMYSSNSR